MSQIELTKKKNKKKQKKKKHAAIPAKLQFYYEQFRCFQKCHAWIQKVLSEGVNSETFFSVYEGREDPNTTESRPISARRRNAI